MKKEEEEEAFGRYGLHTVHTDWHSDMRIDKSRCFSVKQAVHTCW